METVITIFKLFVAGFTALAIYCAIGVHVYMASGCLLPGFSN